MTKNYNYVDDEYIIKLMQDEPVKAMELLIDKYSPLVKTIITRILGCNNKRDIEECIMDVFAELWKQKDKYSNERGSLKNYLISITRYAAFDLLSKIRMNENLPLEIELSDDSNIELQAINDINSEIIKDAINSMEPSDKKIFISRYYYCQRIKDIATSLKVNDKYVSNRLHRGKKILEKKLIEKGLII